MCWGEAARSEPQASDERRKGGEAPPSVRILDIDRPSSSELNDDAREHCSDSFTTMEDDDAHMVQAHGSDRDGVDGDALDGRRR